eukprot:4011810-Pyramimonas_sp.AAC.1
MRPQDSKQIKGAAGLVCCGLCKNVANSQGRIPAGMIDYATATDPSKFDKHTDESMWRAVDRLTAEKPLRAKGKFEELQKLTGVNYDPTSLMFATDIRKFVKPCTGTYIDWMHTVAGSGGTAQYCVNSFALR